MLRLYVFAQWKIKTLKHTISCLFWTHCQGFDDYVIRFPEGAAFDLNQNIQRGKKAYDTMFTLTTGCSHVWLVKQARANQARVESV